MPSISASANRPAVVVPPPESITLTIPFNDARLLRTTLGGLKLKTRGGATAKNGGRKVKGAVARSKTLIKEVFAALDAAGAKKLSDADKNTVSYR